MNDKRKTIVNSIILGLFLCSSMITKLITSVVSFNNNMVIFIGALLVGSMIINLRRVYSLKLLIINMVVAVAFVFSFLANMSNY